MSDLKIIDVYKKLDGNEFKSFKENIRSVLSVSSTYNKVYTNYEWLNIMEECIPYIENIIFNSINIIKEEDESDNGSVSYESRFIYTLIKKIIDYTEKKKEDIVIPYLKDKKKFEYSGKSLVGDKIINMNLSIDSKIDKTLDASAGDEIEILGRISKLESIIKVLTKTNIYKSLDNKKEDIVTTPIKRTKIILNDINFKFAVKLWNFMQKNSDFTVKREYKEKNYEDSKLLKEYINETFLLNYVALFTLDKEIKDSQFTETLTDKLIERLVELNVDLSDKKLKEVIDNKISAIKASKNTSLCKIQNTISEQIKLYLSNIENFDIKRI